MALKPTEDCAADLENWVNSNMLKSNHAKTEHVVFSSKQQVKKTDNLRIKVGCHYKRVSASVRSLGVILDSTLTTKKQVYSICRTCHLSTNI